MKSTFLLSLAAAAGLCVAQLSNIPDCANPCVSKFVSGGNVAGCSSLDAKCICSNDTFIQNITCCISEACDTDDRNTAIKAATDLCSSVGVDVPTSVTCTNGTSTSTITAPSSTATSDDNDNAARRLDGVQAGALGAVAVAAMLLV